MANDGFNESTVSFGGADIGKVRSIDFSDEANEVDVTTLDDAVHAFVSGIPTLECVVEVLGVPAIARGDTGALAVSWFDGDTDAIGSAICTSKPKTGSMDGEATTTYTFKPFGG